MPPKRKRSGGQSKLQNQVKVLAAVTSRKKPTPKAKQTKKPTANKPPQKGKKASPSMPKQTGKSPTKKTRPRRTQAARKKKSEVKSKQLNEPQTSTEEDVKDLLNVLENDDDKEREENSPEDDIIFLEEGQTPDPQEADCEIVDPLNNEIVEQLENLNVIEEGSYINEEEDAEIHEVVEIENFSEFITVECVSEEFVPVAANAEVVIEETDSNEYSEQIEMDFEKINLSESVEADITEDPLQLESNVEENESDTGLKKTKKKPLKKDNKQVKKALAKKKIAKPKPLKKEAPAAKNSPDKTDEVRRSSRIKSINVLKQRSKGHGLVKQQKSSDIESNDNSNASTPDIEKSIDFLTTATSIESETNKPVKVKSRWRKSSELEMNILTPAAMVTESCGDSDKIAEINEMLVNKPKTVADEEEVASRLKQFIHLKENQYKTDRMTCKEAKKMSCDCFLMSEEIERGERGCGEDCLNRLLMIECGSLCPVADRCTNKKFQKLQFAPVEVFKTDKKGLGLRAAANIPYGEFIIEYVGEVLDHEEFNNRADEYSTDNNRHYYFMALRADAIIDATAKGNISRFINHSCEPNAETQKWTVNGELRIGFFSTRTILAGEEITFDYRFERYGKEAQKCFCEAPTCRGWLGEEPEDEDDDEEGSEEEEEEEEEELTQPHKEQVEKSKIPEILKEEQVQEKLLEPVIAGTLEETEITATVEPIASERIPETPKKEKKKSPKRKIRKDKFEDLDQLDEEIEMLITTGLKNQAHTLKLSRLMVRAKESSQRAKLLRVLRRGELPCRRLFLDYHGLRLIHGYMVDSQCLIKSDKKFESSRLELLQTLATLPIPNKTMLQDSKVLSTVQTWATTSTADLPLDSDSSSPQTEHDLQQTSQEHEKKEEMPNVVKTEILELKTGIENEALNLSGLEITNKESPNDSESLDVEMADVSVTKSDSKLEELNYQEEITALASKLLEEWSNLKEVFKIPKKERIEQMKEHEREANRGYIAGIGLEQDIERKSDHRYRFFKRYRSSDNSSGRKHPKDDRYMGSYSKLGKFERRRMFALQVEHREEERRRKQREMWRQHEQHCILLGTDPRLTAPFDPNRGYQCIWNPQIGQWQNYPIQNPNMIFSPQPQNVPTLPPLNIPPPNVNPNYPYMQPSLPPPMLPPPPNSIHSLPSLSYQEEVKKEEDCSQVKFMGPIPPPAILPPKWKCAKDKYSRPYYYHIKIRKSQWEPPPLPPPPPPVQEEHEDSSSTTSSSDTSSLTSDSSSEESENDDELDDTKLLLEVRKRMEKPVKLSFPKTIPKKTESPIIELPQMSPPDEEDDMKADESMSEDDSSEKAVTVEERLKDIFKEEISTSRKRRAGLVSEIIISPRTEEDRLQFREDLKRYKLNKEKLRKEKELILQQSKKHTKEKRSKTTVKLKLREMADCNTESAKKIKETFRSSMATVVVNVLNGYRKSDCKEGRITNTEDFKHLARKLTHFVMLKEMKHIERIEDLVCTENVKGKAKEYIRKYMAKFGENYQKRADEPDY